MLLLLVLPALALVLILAPIPTFVVIAADDHSETGRIVTLPVIDSGGGSPLKTQLVVVLTTAEVGEVLTTAEADEVLVTTMTVTLLTGPPGLMPEELLVAPDVVPQAPVGVVVTVQGLPGHLGCFISPDRPKM